MGASCQEISQAQTGLAVLGVGKSKPKLAVLREAFFRHLLLPVNRHVLLRDEGY